MIKEQQKAKSAMSKAIEIFKSSEAIIRPHFVVTGPSGSGKSHVIQTLAVEHDLNFFEINAAQLTKEGTAGNSLSKALGPLMTCVGPVICFVDEFDKLFISGNNNTNVAHEVTNGVQNEFLRVLEGETTSVFGDFGKYVETPVDNVLFVFAGAFNGEEDITLDKLRSFGIKTEFLGRVGLIYNMTKLGLDSMKSALEDSNLLSYYLELFPDVKRQGVIKEIMKVVEQVHETNTLGIRLLNNLLHQYFINGGCLVPEETKKLSFQKKMELGK